MFNRVVFFEDHLYVVNLVFELFRGLACLLRTRCSLRAWWSIGQSQSQTLRMATSQGIILSVCFA